MSVLAAFSAGLIVGGVVVWIIVGAILDWASK